MHWWHKNFDAFLCSLGIWLLYCTFEISNSFLWQIVQVIQLWMVMLVLGFIGHRPIVMIQLLLHLLRRFCECQNGEVRSLLCLKFFHIWWFSYNIWIIFSVTVIFQCTIHLFHEEHILLSFQYCHRPGLLFLVV